MVQAKFLFTFKQFFKDKLLKILCSNQMEICQVKNNIFQVE